MEKIKVAIKKEEMEFAYIDNILYGNVVNIKQNNISIAGQRLLNKDNISGDYIVKLTNAYIKEDEIIVDMQLEEKTHSDEVSNSIKFYNYKKYEKTNSYKYISKNANRLINTAVKSVMDILYNNTLMYDILKDKVNHAKSDVERIYLLNYLKKYSGKQGKVLFNNLTNNEPIFRSWFPVYHNDEMGLLATFTNYINLHNLSGVVFIEPKDIEYIREIGEEIELSKNREKNNKNYDLEEKSKKVTAVGKSSLLASYCYIDNDSIADNLKTRLNITDDGFGIGKYIFVAAKSIDDFISKDIKKIYSKTKPNCYDKNDYNCTQNCPLCIKKEKMSVVESAVKLIFLHEVGHMAFSNCSRKNKMVVDETAANFFTSLCTKYLPELCMIREMTNFQPEEYKYYFPSLYSFKPIRFYVNDSNPEYIDYRTESAFKTLKYGLMRAEQYFKLADDLIKSLYY